MLRRQIGVGGDKPSLDHHAAGEIEEEGLSGAVVANNEADGGTAVGDPLNVLQDLLHLAPSPHLHVLQACPRYNAGAKRLYERVPLLGLDGHAFLPSSRRL